jgi:hypothetical protein
MELLNQAEVPQAHQGGGHPPLEPEPDKQRELRTSRAREQIRPHPRKGFCVCGDTPDPGPGGPAVHRGFRPSLEPL